MARILSIDDDPLTQAVLQKLMVDAGHEFQARRKPDEALAFARGWKPDLILLDLLMPDADGVAVLEEIRKRQELKSTRVVIVSSRDNPTTILPLLRRGADGYCSKACVLKSLATVVRETLDGQMPTVFPEGVVMPGAQDPDRPPPVVSLQDGLTMLELAGALDKGTEELVLSNIDYGAAFSRNVILDITACTTIEREGVRFLAKLLAAARAKRKSIVIVAGGKQASRLRDEGLDISADIVYDRADALRFLK